MRLLLVEDDPMIGEGVHLGLTQEGYATDWVKNATAAESALTAGAYDLMLLDLGLPGRDGLALLRTLRIQGAVLPVLILTARDGVADRVAGLDAGADDYLVKPFDLEELFARIRALLRRQAGRAEPQLRHGALSLDPVHGAVTMAGRTVLLSAKEFAILQALLHRPGLPLSRGQLEQHVYSWKEAVDSNAVEVHIHALRRKLGAGWILNLRGVGYYVPAEPPVA
ncbi:MAG TPA: response regulator [Thiobacillaceae bacterium]|nr:response regulator [Thiobacillaceae bacterium]HNU64712.1 response regulator [Thiobacillaceae bacterium]